MLPHTLTIPILGFRGLELDVDEVELGQGVLLRRTYAHLMAPFLIAFSPAAPGQPHPPPWKAAHGGFAFDVTAELIIPQQLRNELAERIDMGRVIVALMRVWTSPTITIPVISNLSFSTAAKAADNATRFQPLEIESRYFALEAPEGTVITADRLDWVREHWSTAIELRENHTELRLAMDALDRGQFIRSYALTIVSLWAALEALFSPAKTELRFRVSVLIASYLKEPGKERQKLHGRIMRLYEDRSSAAHGMTKSNPNALLETFELLRQVIIKMVSEHHVPSKEDLEAALFGLSDADETNASNPNDQRRA